MGLGAPPEAKNSATSAAEWWRARSRPPWSLRFKICDASFVPLSSGTKNQPKEEVLARISLRTSGQKLRSGPPSPGKQAFWDGHPARTSMKKLRSEKLRADFSFPISWRFSALVQTSLDRSSFIILETGRIRFRGARFQAPNSVSFWELTEFRAANSVSSFQPIICV